MKYKVKISNFTFGVPSSFIGYKYNADQFKLLGHGHGLPDGTSLREFRLDNVGIYNRILIKFK